MSNENEIAASSTVPTSRRRAKRDQRLKRVNSEIRKVTGHLDDPKYRIVLGTFGRTTLMLRDTYEVIREGGLLNKDGELRSSVDTFTRLAGLQLKLARELGLTPAALGKIRHEKPVDLVGAIADAEIVDE
jgi:hypothetical protein